MKTLISTFVLFFAITLNQSAFAQSKRVAASAGRSEFVEAEPNVNCMLPIWVMGSQLYSFMDGH